MQVVGAVTTTGIYYRPSCAARPDLANTRLFPCAAAAESAGFRACHRCRPYRDAFDSTMDLAPDAHVASAVVDRAVELITEGRLDGGSEAALAALVGVSARHLRRLFADELGATPTRLARSQRAHLARTLLDDSDLRVIDIAFAAGFGSLRQMNRTMLEVFHETPHELRRRRRHADRLVADGGLPLRLAIGPDYDFERELDDLAAHAVPGVESIAEGVFRRVVDVDGDPAVIEVRRLSPSTLLLVAHLPRLQQLRRTVQRMRRLLGIIDSSTRGSWDPYEAAARRSITAAGGPHALHDYVERHGRHIAGVGALGVDRMFPQLGGF